MIVFFGSAIRNTGCNDWSYPDFFSLAEKDLNAAQPLQGSVAWIRRMINIGQCNTVGAGNPLQDLFSTDTGTCLLLQSFPPTDTKC